MGTDTLGLGGLHPASASLVAGSYAWTGDNTITLRLCLYETPYCPTITCRFQEDRILYDMRPNVSFEESEWPQLEGYLV